LSPKQKKIDKNKNGKIDGSDLQALRKESVNPYESLYGKPLVEAKMTWKDWEREGNDAWQSREKRKENPYKKKGQARTSWFDGWDNMQKDSDDGDFDESYDKKKKTKIEAAPTDMDCWDGYKKDGTKPGTGKNKGKQVNNCVPEEFENILNQISDIVNNVTKESVELTEMSPAQLEKLKAGYESLRGKRISAENGLKISRTLEKLDKKSLINLLNADIPFVSTLAVNKLMMNHGMSPADIKNSRGAE